MPIKMAAGSPLGQTDVCSINRHGAGSSQGFQHSFAGLVHTLLGQFIRVLPITMADAILIGCQQPSICCISRNCTHRLPAAFHLLHLKVSKSLRFQGHNNHFQNIHFGLQTLEGVAVTSLPSSQSSCPHPFGGLD